MTKGNLTRAQVIAIVGEETINQLDAINCEPTNRVQCDGDDRVEFAAELSCTDLTGEACSVVAYYYQDESDADSEDLSSLDWTVAGYEIR